jgi:hypothetical protein
LPVYWACHPCQIETSRIALANSLRFSSVNSPALPALPAGVDGRRGFAPLMAAGVSQTLWSLEDVVKMADDYAP